MNVVVGKEPPSDKPAIIISNTKGMELVSKVEEEDIPFIRIGQEATVYINSFGERKFPAVVTEIAAMGKTEGSTVVFETKIRIKDPGPVKVGMTGDADILVEKKEDVLRLPVSSVLVEGRKGTVMLPGAGPNGPKAKDVRAYPFTRELPAGQLRIYRY